MAGPDRTWDLLDSFFSEYFGCDIGSVRPGETRVCASSRREKRELHYADVFPIWCVVTHNRCIISAHRALSDAVAVLVSGWDVTQFREGSARERLTEAAGTILDIDARFVAGPVLFCTPETYRDARSQTCRAVTNADRPALEGTGLLDSSLADSITDGTCFAGYDGNRPVALCGVCPVPHMGDRVADISLNGTLEACRHRGFGKTVLSAVTEALHARGRLPFYITSDGNIASRKTAASVGYVEYGWQLRVKMPVQDE